LPEAGPRSRRRGALSRRLDAYCERIGCGHHAIASAEGLPEDLPIPDAGPAAVLEVRQPERPHAAELGREPLAVGEVAFSEKEKRPMRRSLRSRPEMGAEKAGEPRLCPMGGYK
jgi:hypothetical protein